jgi:hypothetical protein
VIVELHIVASCENTFCLYGAEIHDIGCVELPQISFESVSTALDVEQNIDMIAIVYEQVLLPFVLSQNFAMREHSSRLTGFNFIEISIFVKLDDHVVSLCCVEKSETFSRIVDNIAESTLIYRLKTVKYR